jgi:hypothetical protein
LKKVIRTEPGGFIRRNKDQNIHTCTINTHSHTPINTHTHTPDLSPCFASDLCQHEGHYMILLLDLEPPEP